jgi:diacylglycerol kinase
MKNRLAFWGYAWKGIIVFLRHCRNVRWHLSAAALAIALGAVLGISKGQWVAIVLVIALVLVAEMINEAIELLCDHLHPEQHPAIGRVKDISAGAVLLAAITAVVVGMLVFLPYLV